MISATGVPIVAATIMPLPTVPSFGDAPTSATRLGISNGASRCAWSAADDAEGSRTTLDIERLSPSACRTAS